MAIVNATDQNFAAETSEGVVLARFLGSLVWTL